MILIENKGNEVFTKATSLNSSKKGNLTIDETQIIQPDEIPKGSRFKGYQERVIQDITFQTRI
jgi:hypothetical protein